MDPLKEWLDTGVNEGIFEPVPDGEAITWCSPLVVQPKPKFIGQKTLKSDQIRACVDMREVNKSMKRTRIQQAPLVEDFTYRFHDCKVFSKLDMKHGYHQLVMDEDSRKIATFSTPWGNYRPRRLIFGAKSSQDLFDNTMQRIFGDIPRVLNQRDDILLGGRDVEEHDEVLRKVLQRGQDYNVTFNKEKCVFRTEEITFFGQQFTKDGLQPDPKKVQAVVNCEPPQSKEETRSFLGMTGYLSDFIPGYASIAAPLRELTRKDIKFRWGTRENQAFESLKKAIAAEKTMAYFDPKRPIMVRTEASFNEGLAAALFQKHGSSWKPVHFISRALSDVEKRYSQTEKDALAIAWAKRRFSLYLLGAPRFQIITAHKPLIPLFNKTNAKIPPRIEKWVMEMQDVDFELTYRPGKDAADPLDFLSRHPLRTTVGSTEDRAVKWVTHQEHAVLMEDIQKATTEDEELQMVLETARKGNWERYKKDPDMQPYYHVRGELYEVDGMLMRDNKVVLPRKLRRKTVIIAHLMGHLGKSKTKEMLRRKYWFPDLGGLVDNVVGQCFDCAVATKDHRTEPLKMTEIPEKPWSTVAADFGGPYPDGHYNLVIVDKRTRYPVVEEVPSTGFESTKVAMKKTFATYGTPERIETDGGPPFNSKDFEQFSKQEGFKHHVVTPDHARANGTVERFMQSLNKTERIIRRRTKNKDDRRNAIQDMLTAYRETPHPATGVAPNDAMGYRTIRTKLDAKVITKPNDQAMTKRDKQYKEKIRAQKEKTNMKTHNLMKGDCVLIKQRRINKWTLPYEPVFYSVIDVKGSTVTARRISDGRIITRDGSHFKLANMLMREEEEILERYAQDVADDTNPDDDESWREQVMQNAQPQTPRSRPTTPTMPDIPPTPLRPPTPRTPPTRDNQPMRSYTPATTMTPPRPSRARNRPGYLQDYVS